jgi:hypothetical protein
MKPFFLGIALVASFFSANAQSVSASSLSTSASQSSKSVTHAFTTQNTYELCWSQSVPPGWVMVATRFNYACNFGHIPFQSYTAKIPGPSEFVCRESPIPSGYVITGIRFNSNCQVVWDYGFDIKIPGEYETICENSYFPPNYTVIERVHVSVACDWRSAFKIRRLY